VSALKPSETSTGVVVDLIKASPPKQALNVHTVIEIGLTPLSNVPEHTITDKSVHQISASSIVAVNSRAFVDVGLAGKPGESQWAHALIASNEIPAGPAVEARVIETFVGTEFTVGASESQIAVTDVVVAYVPARPPVEAEWEHTIVNDINVAQMATEPMSAHTSEVVDSIHAR
jgi:hypothetical protein